MKKLVLKKCNKCGALVEVLKDCTCDNCGVICCESKMQTIIPNSEEAAFEKHIPVCTKENDNLVITVNHVMDEDHYIEWLKVITNDAEITKDLTPGEEIKLTVPYKKGMVIYSYCNKHGLWQKEVE